MDQIIAKKIARFCRNNYIRQPMIVGGAVRNIVLNQQNQVHDIDLTTNNSDVTRLAIGFATENDIFFKVFKDMHVTCYIDLAPDLDFSSNFISAKAVDFFKNTKYSDPKYYEVISRDFTINTLHKSMFNNDIIDPLDCGVDDCNNKVLKCISSPEITFYDDPRRVYRVITMSSKFDLSIDGGIMDYVKKNVELYSSRNPLISDSFILHEIEKAMDANEDRFLQLSFDTGLIKHIPLIGKFKDFIIKNNLTSKYLDLNKNKLY
jgi:tRNA nucleotidyltransferase/poly(A) polymerase